MNADMQISENASVAFQNHYLFFELSIMPWRIVQVLVLAY